MTLQIIESQLETSETITNPVLPDINDKAGDKIESEYMLSANSSNSTIAFIQDDGIEYPEGGFQAYIVVFGCFMGLTACFGLLNCIGVIETYIQHHQLSDVSSSTIGWIFSIFAFTNFFTCIFSGTYFDRNGARAPLIVGGVLQTGGLFGMANATKLWHFILAFSICSGIGNGILASPLVSVPSHYFNKKRGNATALATMGGSIGGVYIPLMLRSLFVKIGFKWSVRTLAFINMACIALAVVLARERLPGKKSDESLWKTYILNSFDSRVFTDKTYLFCVLGCFLVK